MSLVLKPLGLQMSNLTSPYYMYHHNDLAWIVNIHIYRAATYIQKVMRGYYTRVMNAIDPNLVLAEAVDQLTSSF